ncbi:MAG: Xenobiotic-transporting ATPase [Candidatus Yanofskybacteria bacterium GW2011_GWA1_44_21]|uniref:ABC transporter ATP-binding protein n=2 Tax=Parcubacteria group TaxID=1794811 RepID=A0A1F8H2B5_9BACT|nr:MAG: Xenobiotic-transporting ATPase [Candidatus Wolfebacteria bacterium GW2011_GWB1_41_12]KKT28952.1 MAG: Xenobiotic-transporting ATPase [Candidatus Yanofskybacteria bacterium GW2011_GWA2_44_10]KKT50742.1 MAG: Xenobiotic-transporting ATPase [Candidatus Yanofskybacteria bacterium GW2011_GWA1_44_21]OGN14180.1 MAG: hypothetical protein A3C01_01115 [Candidatus Yanofskybacteria bacterium RIFCSPHIGHO2_02_FULL_44_36b]OGN31046.1 MAG: hypothetical protein A3I96_01985 [Candidatus Yanofskybacteria bact
MYILKKITYLYKLTASFITSYKKRFVFIVLLGFINGLAGSVGIGIIIPLFSVFTGSGIAGTDFITSSTEKFFMIFKIPLTAPSLIIFMVLLFALKAFAQFIAKYNTEKLAAGFEENLRSELLKKTLKTGWPYLSNQKIGHLERTLFYDINQSTTILLQIGTGILILTSFITYSIVAFKISAPITLATLLFGIILFPILKPLFYKIRKLSEQTSQLYKQVANHVSENIIGIKVVKTTATEDAVIKAGNNYFKELKLARTKSGMHSYAIGSSIEPIGIVFVGVLFILTYRLPGFNIASFGVVVYLIQKIFSFIQSIQGQFQTFVSITPNIENVISYRLAIEKNSEENLGSDPFIFIKSLEFVDVGFSHDKDSIILKKINLSVGKGQMIGIIGPSGAGKTTTADILLRLLVPKEGQILLDGKDYLKTDIKEWRKNIGYVPQDIFLINDTIENNIIFYDKSISKEEIIEATKTANIYDFIEGLPDKFNTVAGERGVKLSGGQKQRIVLARALARKPQILILDEATSAIDNESEMLIQEAIQKLKGQVTVIIIAHRINTIMRTDYVFVIDGGKLVESGQPNELLKNNASYLHRVYHL